MLHYSVCIARLWLFAGVLSGLTAVASGTVAKAEAVAKTDDAATAQLIDDWLETANFVLARHVDPPTRQELLKVSLQAIYKVARQDPPVGMATRISLLGGEDEVRGFLASSIATLAAEQEITAETLRQELFRGLLARVAQRPGLMVLDEGFFVQEQLRDNRYVGIGIQLGMRDEYPTMIKAIPRGPAWQAGGRDGDQMLSIDGIDAKNMKLPRVIELLRGQEGKPATIIVRKSASDPRRILQMVRGVVPFDTVLGTKRDADQNWLYKVEADPRIAYVKIESLRGSTPAELRRIASQLHADACRGLILDLRQVESGELRYAIMVADLLMGAGPIGQVLDARGRQQFDASGDQLFPGWPIAVLIDRRTAEQAEWIAAALHDSARAKLVGQPTAGRGAIFELVELPRGIGGIRMHTRTLFRRGGQPMATPQDKQANVLRAIGGRATPGAVPGMWMGQQGLLPDQVSRRHMADALKLIQGMLGSDAAEARTEGVGESCW